MPLPQLARYADAVRYDAERGLALALDLARVSGRNGADGLFRCRRDRSRD